MNKKKGGGEKEGEGGSTREQKTKTHRQRPSEEGEFGMSAEKCWKSVGSEGPRRTEKTAGGPGGIPLEPRDATCDPWGGEAN